MVSKINENKKQWFYILVSILVVLIFLFLSLNVREEISEGSEEKSELIAGNIARKNILIVRDVIQEYVRTLEQMQRMSSFTSFSKDEIGSMLDYIIEKDSVVKRSWFCGCNDCLIVRGRGFIFTDYKSLWGKLSSGGPFYLEFNLGNDITDGFIRLAVPFYSDKGSTGYMGIDIDLKRFHNHVAGFSELRSGYVTIISDNDLFVLHPDERLTGRPVTEKDRIYKLKSVSTGDIVSAKVYSGFLNMNVFRYYAPMSIRGYSWVVTANVPSVGMEEYVAEISRSLLLIAIGALLSFAAVILLGFYRWRKEFVYRKEVENKNLMLQLANERQKQSSLSSELENLKSGLNPHFLFNSLTTLKILINKDAEKAKDFTLKLSGLYRYLLDHEKENTVTLDTELAFAEDYIYLQKIRFRDAIVFNTDIPDGKAAMRVPPVSVQILIENCVKHNAASKYSPLEISLYIEDDFVVVRNNINPRHSQESSTGKGLDNLHQRYSFLTDRKCKFYEKEGYFYAMIPLLNDI